MTSATYEQMKYSGTDWLGRVPASWTLQKLNRVATRFSNGTTATQLDSDSDFPVTRIQTISSGKINLSKIGYISRADAIEKYLLRKNDVLFSHINSLSMVGNVAKVDIDGLYHGMNLLRITPTKINPDFLMYVLQSSNYQQYFSSIAKPAINQASITASDVKATLIALPSDDEQKRIASYLDDETARIDLLIAKQEKLLELLEEKRRATITQAVIRGLDPNVELKKTGIAWLGKIPAHWEIKKLKYLFSINDETLSANTDPNYEFEYVDISSVDKYQGIINREAMTFESSPSRARRIVRKGDIIVGAVRTYLEAIAQIMTSDENTIVSTGFAVLRPKEISDSDYYTFAIRSGAFMANVAANSDGISYPAINADKLVALSLPLPPEEERDKIADLLHEYMEKMDRFKHKLTYQINLLKERRSSLIFNTVTGKVRV